MKTYRIERGAQGVHARVTIWEKKGVGAAVPTTAYDLPARTEEVNHSVDGYEFGYRGSGPAQLAYALLRDHFKNLHPPERARQTALDLYVEFASGFVEMVPQFLSAWEMTTAEIDKAVEATIERLGLEERDLKELEQS